VKTNPDFKRVQPLPVVSDLFVPIVTGAPQRLSDGTPSHTSLPPPIMERIGYASSGFRRESPPAIRAVN